MNQPKNTAIVLTNDQLCALQQLLSLVHYDDLALSWRNILPNVLFDVADQIERAES